MPSEELVFYAVDSYQLHRMQEISDALHSGNDTMRDLGHRLWLVLSQVKEKEIGVIMTKVHYSETPR